MTDEDDFGGEVERLEERLDEIVEMATGLAEAARLLKAMIGSMHDDADDLCARMDKAERDIADLQRRIERLIDLRRIGQ